MQQPTGRSAPPAEGTVTTASEPADMATPPMPGRSGNASVASAPGPDGAPATTDPLGPALPSPRASIEALTADVLPALIARLSASDLGELEVRTPAWRVRLRRALSGAELDASRAGGPDGRNPARAPGPTEGTLVSDRSPRTQGGAGQPVMSFADDAGRAERQAPDRRAALPDRQPATSPAVGYFSPRDEMRRGQRVQVGDLLGIVDVLGVRHDVTSPIDGFVSRQIALAGEAVEYGQPLVEIEGLPARPRAGSGSVDPSAADDPQAGAPIPDVDGAVVVGEAV